MTGGALNRGPSTKVIGRVDFDFLASGRASAGCCPDRFVLLVVVSAADTTPNKLTQFVKGFHTTKYFLRQQ